MCVFVECLVTTKTRIRVCVRACVCVCEFVESLVTTKTRTIMEEGMSVRSRAICAVAVYVYVLGICVYAGMCI